MIAGYLHSQIPRALLIVIVPYGFTCGRYVGRCQRSPCGHLEPRRAALASSEEEQRLRDLVAGVHAAQVAKTNAVPFRRVVDHYRHYMIENRKGYEHERYRIDKIEKFIGPERDVATIDYDLYIALLDLYCHGEPALLQHRA